MKIETSRDWFCAMGAFGFAILAILSTINDVEAPMTWGALVISLLLFLEVTRP